MKYLREYQALGTAGGLYHFRDAILKGHTDRFFVLNADVCCSFPLEQMLRLFEEKDGEAVILGTRVANDAATNFGCIVSDTHSKRVLHYVEKPESHISNLINCGVYLFSTEAFFPSIKSAMKRRADRPRLLSYPSSDTLDSSYVARSGQDNDDDGEKTGHRLSVLLTTVRGVLDPDKEWPADHYVASDATGLWIDLRHVSVDADDVITDTSHALALLRAGDTVVATEILADVDRRYRGDAFEDKLSDPPRLPCLGWRRRRQHRDPA